MCLQANDKEMSQKDVTNWVVKILGETIIKLIISISAFVHIGPGSQKMSKTIHWAATILLNYSTCFTLQFEIAQVLVRQIFLHAFVTGLVLELSFKNEYWNFPGGTVDQSLGTATPFLCHWLTSSNGFMTFKQDSFIFINYYWEKMKRNMIS